MARERIGTEERKDTSWPCGKQEEERDLSAEKGKINTPPKTVMMKRKIISDLTSEQGHRPLERYRR